MNGRVNSHPAKISRRGSVQSWHVTVQREVLQARTSIVDVAYVGNKQPINLMILGDLNQARPNAAGENTDVAGASSDPGLSVHPVGV